MRAEGQGWVVWQPSDDEDESVTVSIQNDWIHFSNVRPTNDPWAAKTFTQPEAQKLYDALGDALGNMQPPQEPRE